MFVLPQSFFSPFLFLRPCSDAPLPGAGTARRGAAAALPILLVFPVGVFLDLKDQIPQLSIASNFLLCLNKRATTQRRSTCYCIKSRCQAQVWLDRERGMTLQFLPSSPASQEQRFCARVPVTEQSSLLELFGSSI
ncbi:lipopolysaccharide-induced tumor necrosis factor-alpha factor isoform X2 [Athene noctua]|uniref:lipopolysaccharide-induced tumor necrosis factor-alpha factor isoform X2 n=1 Tax=Athene noctua TaxID=126797 RepID=UPI003EB743A4